MSKKNIDLEITLFDLQEQLGLLKNVLSNKEEIISDVTYLAIKKQSRLVFVHQSAISSFDTEEIDIQEVPEFTIKRTYINTNVEDGKWEGFKLQKETKTFI